jgi:hypothetical protein
MTFSTLENKFNAVATQIYNKFSSSDQQLVTVKPDTPASRSRIKDDSRLLPIVSTVRDTVLLTKFLSTSRGQLFIAKQLLLQTGNTFAEARLYNPASPLIAAIPGIPRIPRQLGLGGGGGNLGTSLTNPNLDTYRGALQNETVGKLSGNSLLTRIFTQNPVSSVFKALFVKPKQTKYFNDSTKEYYVRPEDSQFYTTPITLKWSRNGDSAGYLDTAAYDILGSRQFEVQPLSQRGTTKQNTTFKTNFVKEFIKFGTTKPPRSTPASKTFKELENTSNTNGYFSGKLLNVQDFTSDIDNAIIAGQTVQGTNVKYPTIIDPYNGILATPGQAQAQAIDQNGNLGRANTVGTPSITSLYKDIMGDPKVGSSVYSTDDKSDIIKFIFRRIAPTADAVHFRAFLSSLKENVKPEFTEQRYLGRTERFVTYGGVKRTITLAFNIVAFSEQERDQVWKRINFLTGLAYPTDVSSTGFMVPPLFNITVGGVYDDHPCYIDSLNYTFLDENITFDIDAEVPTVVDVDMSIVLLEKRSRYYDSPFYKIVEDL